MSDFDRVSACAGSLAPWGETGDPHANAEVFCRVKLSNEFAIREAL